METDRLEKQIRFLLEIDKLKTILRRTYILHADRSENTAEHSWHLAITARFASALDRFIPQLHNYHTQGRTWKEHGITADRVLDRNACIADGSSTLWEWAQALLNDAVEKGFLRR